MNLPSAALAALSGLGFGLSLIVAIGAQNAFVLRQGIRGRHVFPVVMVCTVSDMVLIGVGVGGFGAIVTSRPALLNGARYAGAAFLLGYAALAVGRACRASAMTADGAGVPMALKGTVATCLALTWLNPHVYLDTIVLLGSFASTHAAPERWFLAMGAMAASTLWFTGLGYGARLLAPLFARPLAWRILDSAIAAVMVALAIGLLVADVG